MIDFKNVTKVYEPKITALKNVNVHIDKGEFVFVLGHSGAGKSTFLKLMLREEKATKGEVIVNGYNLSKIKEKDIPYMRRTLGVVFQDFRLIPNQTSYENIAFAMRVTNIDEKEIKKRVPYILSLVGLEKKGDKLPSQLSGGEQQRVALARALVHNPDLVIADEPTGKWWMHYGSFFGGLYCVELNPETGLVLNEGDWGHLVARRANYRKDNLEAPEIIYHPELKQYYLFTSYDPLMTTYNVRVSRSDAAEGPFTDYFGKAVKDTTNNFPILTAPYRFENHTGWAGTAHCAVFSDNEGNYFMAHQGRLSPQNQLMVLHIRQLFFTPEGWPVASPERYAGTASRQFSKEDLVGEWEIIRVQEPAYERQLEAGQILWGEGELKEKEWNLSTRMTLAKDGTCKGQMTDNEWNIVQMNGKWSFLTEKHLLMVDLNSEKIENLVIFAGHDWENETETILFTGLDSRGRSVWGKRIK